MAELQLALDDTYRWEKTAPDQLWMTQPIGNGEIETYTWGVLPDSLQIPIEDQIAKEYAWVLTP